jgi:hypothetical protein
LLQLCYLFYLFFTTTCSLPVLYNYLFSTCSLQLLVLYNYLVFTTPTTASLLTLLRHFFDTSSTLLRHFFDTSSTLLRQHAGTLVQGRREVSFVFTRLHCLHCLQLIVRLIEMISTLFQPFSTLFNLFQTFFKPFSTFFNLFPTFFQPFPNLFQPVATSKGATFARCRCPGVGVKARPASVGRGEFCS